MDAFKELIVNEMAETVFISLPEARRRFRQYFPGLRFKNYMDPLLSVMSGEPKIDIGAFENWLHKQHGDYEDMETLLVAKYSPSAAAFIKTLL